MTAGFLDGNVFRGLAFRVLLFLSLALLPIGLIAIVQTREIAHQSDISAELSLLALTEQASSAERQAIQEGFGAAKALSLIVRVYDDDPDACRAFLREYKLNSNRYSLVGFLRADGQMECSSADQSFDFSGFEVYADSLKNPVPRASFHPMGPLSGRAVVALTQPFFDDETLLGFITLSIPTSSIGRVALPAGSQIPVEVVTFNAKGELLISEGPKNEAETQLPQHRNLSLLVGADPAVFRDVNGAGAPRVYAVSPVVPGVAYAMSIWDEQSSMAQVERRRSLSTFLPVIMWIASLVVAFWALDRLAITHIKQLGRQMRHFAFNRTLPRSGMGRGVPREIVDMEQAFVGMAESILRDEASLEDSLREKNILLKEVHHRVKNNLQLISSIMNMQIRQARTEDARFVLRRLQERILSLATVHKSLYQNDELSRVDGGALISEIVGQLLSVGLPAGSHVDVTQSYEPISLDPDDAAPLTLMVSEAMTNALKYIGAENGARPRIDITLKYTGPESAMLQISNSTKAKTDENGTGLGAQLITAFTRQLNGQIEMTESDGMHHLTLNFPVPHKVKETHDY